MRAFFKKKIELIAKSAAIHKRAFFLELLIKFLAFLGSIVWKLFDAVLLLLLCPVFLVCYLWALAKRKSSKKNKAYFIGLEHVIRKTIERAQFMHEKGFPVTFYSFESTGQRFEGDYRPRIRKYTALASLDLLAFAWQLIHEKPCYIEVYYEGNGFRQWVSVFFAKAIGSLVVSIERGSLVNLLNHTMTYAFRYFLFSTQKRSDKVFFREGYMLDIYQNVKFPAHKLFFDHNKIPIYAAEPEYDKQEPIVLFLNGFAEIRRLDLLAKAIPLVAEKIPDVKFLIAGGRFAKEIQEVQQLLVNAKADAFAEIKGWVDKPGQLYEKAMVFVLPADIVFCNFSLIEAMERGVPPVIAKVRDADKIVEHGVSGLLCEQSAESLASCIVHLLENKETRIKIAKGARVKVCKDFDAKDRMKPVLDLISSYYGKK